MKGHRIKDPLENSVIILITCLQNKHRAAVAFYNHILTVLLLLPGQWSIFLPPHLSIKLGSPVDLCLFKQGMNLAKKLQ